MRNKLPILDAFYNLKFIDYNGEDDKDCKYKIGDVIRIKKDTYIILTVVKEYFYNEIEEKDDEMLFYIVSHLNKVEKIALSVNIIDNDNTVKSNISLRRMVKRFIAYKGSITDWQRYSKYSKNIFAKVKAAKNIISIKNDIRILKKEILESI